MNKKPFAVSAAQELVKKRKKEKEFSKPTKRSLFFFKCFTFEFIRCSLNIHTLVPSTVPVRLGGWRLNPVMRFSDYSFPLNSINY